MDQYSKYLSLSLVKQILFEQSKKAANIVQFADVIGQDEIKSRLLNSVTESRISHAQLFLGDPGNGVLPMALAYAQYISCENRGENDSCGNCTSCVKYGKLVHPDLHFSFPVILSKDVKTSTDLMPLWRKTIIENPYLDLFDWYLAIGNENKQGVINVAESDQIVKKLGLKTYESEYKIVIIWMPEKLHINAANKLLKILEEPPDKTLFILVAENSDQLLPTIISRLQLVKIPQVKEAALELALSEKYNIESKEIKRISFLSEGNVNTALKMLDSADEEASIATTFIEWMRLCYGKKWVELVEWVDKVSSIGRESQKKFFEYALFMVRESLLKNLTGDELVRLQDEELMFLKNFAPFIHEANCHQITEELSTAIRHIERNANPKVLFLDISLKISKLIRIKLPTASV